MNYHSKYLKYKLKYLNLLTKTKRISTDDTKITRKKITQDEMNGNVLNDRNDDKDIKLSSLFNIFVTEPLYELVDDIKTTSDMMIGEESMPAPTLVPTPTEKMPIESERNLRKTKLKREDPDFFYGSYTPEIIRKLESNGLDHTMIRDLIKKFDDDDKENMLMLYKQNPLYINFDNNGKIIECWVADNMCCPCCGSKSLRRYVKDNIPCIDLMCVNPEHKFTDGVKFFQVKAKSYNTNIYKNFDFTTKQIHTGSKVIGQYIHGISIHDELYGLLMGYICIEYVKLIKEHNEIIKILNGSFLVLPKINIKISKKLFDDDEMSIEYDGLEKYQEPTKEYCPEVTDRYYWYVDSNPFNNTIEFSSNNNDIIFFTPPNKNILFGTKTPMEFVTTDYDPNQSKWKIISNPFIV